MELISHRLHPLSIFYKFLISLPSFAIPIYFLILGDFTELIFIFLMIFFGFFSVTNLILNYFYFTYTLTNKEIIIKSGVFSKRIRHISIKRIQNISTQQNFLHKILRIVKVQFETAGDSASEGVLDSVSKSESERLIALIKNYQIDNLSDKTQNEETSKESSQQSETSKNSYLFKHNFASLLKYGMVRFRPIGLILSAWIFGMVSQYLPNWTEYVEELLEIGYKDFIKNMDVFYITLYIVVIIFAFLFLSWILDIILTINQFYNYKLSQNNNKLLARFGLLSTKEITIPLKKLQTILLTANPLLRKLKYYNMRFQTAGFGSSDPKGKSVEGLIPFVNRNFASNLIENIFNVILPDRFDRVSKKTIRRAFIRYFILFIPIIILLNRSLDLEFSLLLFIPLILTFSWLRYLNRGYYIQDNQVFIKQGLWFHSISVIPIEKLQTLILKQTFFQRRLELCTIIIDTAATSSSNDASIIDIDIKDGELIYNELLSLFQQKKRL